MQNLIFFFFFSLLYIEFDIFLPFVVCLLHTVLFCVVFNLSCIDISLIAVAIFDAGFGLNGIQSVRIWP